MDKDSDPINNAHLLHDLGKRYSLGSRLADGFIEKDHTTDVLFGALGRYQKVAIGGRRQGGTSDMKILKVSE